jgi:signal transduction histidine kinase
MKQTIYFKFILGYLLFGLSCILVIDMWTAKETVDTLTSDKASMLYSDSQTIVNNYFQSGSIEVIDATTANLLNTTATVLDVRIWIMTAEGTVIFDSESSQSQLSFPEFDATNLGNRYYMVGNFYEEFKEETLTVISPIIQNFSTNGYLMFHQQTDSIRKNANSVVNITYKTAGIIFLLSLIILLLFTLIVFLPIQKISLASREFAKGNLTYDGLKDFTSDDEIGRLGVSLNFMASELYNLEEDQKKFIANVSHDFRSPLTSIKGYVEAMKDGTIPVELQGKYLDIVLFEADRLTKLTESLLTLNAWDTKGNRLEITDFNLYDLLKPIVTTFEGKCEKKRISIDLILGSKDYVVSADRGKIQQVIYNLIDNAIKFSNHDSTITVKVTDKNEKIFVSIKDTGIGIPKESLAKIWDRFYKTDLSRGKDKTGTGLGLAITKEVITAHNENINVISTIGAGTEFIFTLQKGKK